MNSRTLLAGAIFAASFAAPALADESWSLPSGNQVVYDRDIGNTAVLTYQPEQGQGRGQVFVVGLGGRSANRGQYTAYWVEADDAGPACPAAIVDAEGRMWRRWGLATVVFGNPNGPSAISISQADCLTMRWRSVTARPVEGGGVR